MDRRKKGVAIGLGAVLCVTPDAMLLRWARAEGASSWETVFWKLGLMGAFNLAAALWAVKGWKKFGASMSADPLMLAAAALLQVCDQLGFTFSFLLTETARAMLFISLNPVWAALLGWRFLGDRPPRRTMFLLVAGLMSTAIAIVPTIFPSARMTEASDSTDAQQAHHQPETVGGDIVAVLTGICLATYVTLIRYLAKHRPKANIVAAPSIGNFLCAAMAAPLAATRRGSVLSGIDTGHYFPVVVANAFFMAIFYVLFSLAPRYIPGAEVALILLLETLLSPLCVYLRFGDVPSAWTVLSGGLLLAALVAHEVAGILESRKQKTTTRSGKNAEALDQLALLLSQGPRARAFKADLEELVGRSKPATSLSSSLLASSGGTEMAASAAGEEVTLSLRSGAGDLDTPLLLNGEGSQE